MTIDWYFVYSSNVSSLSRTSVTPHLPPANLSPQLSYSSKAASWLRYDYDELNNTIKT
jgi:hypothetical protein